MRSWADHESVFPHAGGCISDARGSSSNGWSVGSRFLDLHWLATFVPFDTEMHQLTYRWTGFAIPKPNMIKALSWITYINVINTALIFT